MSVALPRPLSIPRSAAELAAVLATGALHLAWPSLPIPRIVFTVLAVGGWGAYLWWMQRREPGRLADLGFGRDGLTASMRVGLPVGVGAAVGMAALGEATGSAVWSWHMLVCMLVYPLWGLVQQLMVQGMVNAPLSRRFGPTVGVVLSATVFGLVHWPHDVLMVATFALGLVFGPLYLRHRNLWVLGLLHGWLGTLLYFLVLGEDPLVRVLT